MLSVERKNPAPLRMPEMFVLSQYQDLFGHPKCFHIFSINRISPKQTCPDGKKQAAHIFQLFSAKFPVSHFRHRNQWLQHAAECLLRMLGCLSFGVNWGVESTHCASCATAPLMLIKKMHEVQAMLFLGR